MEKKPKINPDNPELWKSAYGFNIMLEARIGTMVQMTQKYTDIAKPQLKVMVGALIERYWKEEDDKAEEEQP